MITKTNETTFLSSKQKSIEKPKISLHSKFKKKIGNYCFTLEDLKQLGNFNVYYSKEKLALAKIRLVEFDDNFNDLLEKGLTSKVKSIPDGIPDMSFWQQRYYYYSQFDKGIQMDEECWWSVTPEIIAEYIAKLCPKDSVIIEGFCGSGGNVIQFSNFCKKVYAIDINRERLNICKNNCKIYNCKDNIEYILNDFLQMDKSPIFQGKNKADYIFLSPPWGGIKYKSSSVYSIKELMTPSIYDIIKVSLKVSKKILFYLPRNLMLTELVDILGEILNEISPGLGDRIYFDVHILKSANKIKAQLIIFGEDPNKNITEADLEEYIKFQYEEIKPNSLKVFLALAKILGNFKFLQTLNFIKSNYNCEKKEDFPTEVIKYFFTKILNEQEKIKLKSWNLFGGKKKKSNEIVCRRVYEERKNDSDSILNSKVNYCFISDEKNILKSNKKGWILKPKLYWNLEKIHEIHIQFLPS